MAKRKNKSFPKQITVYATAEEKEVIERRAREGDHASRSRFVVRAAVEGAVVEVKNETDAEGGAATDQLRELKEKTEHLLFEVNRVGVNLNTVLRKIESAREYEIIPSQELRLAADQIERAAAAVAADAGVIQQKIDRADADAERRKRSAIERAKSELDQSQR